MFFLFSDSVNFNIAYGKQEATRDEIKQASQQGRLTNLSANYLTDMQRRWGAWRKTFRRSKTADCFSTCFSQNPPVMVFDEATSALDTKTERRIQVSLDKLVANRTTLIIAHRLSTIMNADKIVVLENGSIAESGTHQELLAKTASIKNYTI